MAPSGNSDSPRLLRILEREVDRLERVIDRRRAKLDRVTGDYFKERRERARLEAAEAKLNDLRERVRRMRDGVSG